MPSCPHCQANFEQGQRYCQVCGSYLLHPETGDTFCPQCGIRVSKRQEFCHECDAPIKGEAAAAEAAAPKEQSVPAAAQPSAAQPPAAPASGMQPWMVGLLIAGGVIILILFIMLFSRGDKTVPPPPTPAPKAEVPSAPATPPAPGATAPAPAPQAQPANIKDQVQAALSKMREARLNKDVALLMSCYSATFPDLEEKREEAQKAWNNYDYTNMVFTIDSLEPLDADNASAKVTWYVDLKSRSTGEMVSAAQTFKVRFAKELGQWRIRSLEEIQ